MKTQQTNQPKQNTAKKLGRPFGSSSFTEIKLAELIEKYKPDTILPVSRVFLKKTEPKPEQEVQMVTLSVNVPLAKAQSSMEIINRAFESGQNASRVEMVLAD